MQHLSWVCRCLLLSILGLGEPRFRGLMHPRFFLTPTGFSCSVPPCLPELASEFIFQSRNGAFFDRASKCRKDITCKCRGDWWVYWRHDPYCWVFNLLQTERFAAIWSPARTPQISMPLLIGLWSTPEQQADLTSRSWFQGDLCSEKNLCLGTMLHGIDSQINEN